MRADSEAYEGTAESARSHVSATSLARGGSALQDQLVTTQVRIGPAVDEGKATRLEVRLERCKGCKLEGEAAEPVDAIVLAAHTAALPVTAQARQRRSGLEHEEVFDGDEREHQ